MVGFVGRFRKPKSPIVLGSPNEDDEIPSQTPATPQRFRPPVLRNFSYPTNIGSQEQPPPFPSSRATQTPWDQLGEICSFSPDSVSRVGQARTPGLEDPFFYKSEPEPYSRLDDDDDQSDGFSIGISSDQLFNPESPSQEEPKTRKKQRRSTLLGLSSSQDQNKAPKLPRGQSLGNRIFAQTLIVPSRLKRTPSSQHKTAVSLDASRLIVLPSSSPDRPASSSGIPLIDTTLKPPSPTAKVGPSTLSFQQDIASDSSVNPGVDISVPEATAAMKTLEMDPNRHSKASYGSSGSSNNTMENGDSRKRNASVSGSVQRKRKDGKHGWMSQIKGWVSTSEPSAQALKQYKKETYKKANIALDDPQANAKLHLPIGTLPRDAIKPAGRGHNPEEVAFKEAGKGKKLQRSKTQMGGTAQGSRSSTSHYSSSSSVALSATGGEAPRI
ncbi:hypothetical protein F4677DRAFT_458405 [Hypoxylon crocopeplum]|nr:hypothetical protein F4677DRAFT_458405 [Hypoxylon crocopeplum]